MRPVNINLVVKKNIWAKISIAFIAVLTVITCAVTMVNTYDYFANTKVIRTYERRIKDIKQRTEQKRLEDKKASLSSAKVVRYKQDIVFFSKLIAKNLFPLHKVLDEIEKAKPQKINIDSLRFSKDLYTVRITGHSTHVPSVSKFIIDLDKSESFEVELSKEEIKENKKIVFELTAKWADVKNG